MHISLNPEQEQFIGLQVQTGRFVSREEVVREALSLLEERCWVEQKRLESLRRDLAAGVEQANRGELIDSDEVYQEFFPIKK